MLKFMLIICIVFMLYLGVRSLKDSVFNICMGMYYMKHIDKLQEEIKKYDEMEGKDVTHDEDMVALSVKTVLTENLLHFILGVICLVTVVGMVNFIMV